MKNRYLYKRSSIQVPQDFINWVKETMPKDEMVNHFIMQKMGYFDSKLVDESNSSIDESRLIEYAKKEILKKAYKK